MLHAMNLSRFDLVTLRLFVFAVEGGSLTAAANRIGMSVAAASRRVAELEVHVGARLLRRSRQGVEPTAAGLIFLQHASPLASGVEQLAVAMNDLRVGGSGELRLWANTSAFSGFLIPVLAAYARQNPTVTLELEDAMSEDSVEAVAEGRAEIAIVGGNTPVGQLEADICSVDELVAIVPCGHMLARRPYVSLKECLAHDLIALHPSTSLARQIEALARGQGAMPRVRARVRNFDAMCRMVAAGLGVALLPSLAVAPHLRNLGLAAVRFSDVPAERRLLVVRRDRRRLSPPARLFMDLLELRPAGSASPISTPALVGAL